MSDQYAVSKKELEQMLEVGRMRNIAAHLIGYPLEKLTRAEIQKQYNLTPHDLRTIMEADEFKVIYGEMRRAITGETLMEMATEAAAEKESIMLELKATLLQNKAPMAKLKAIEIYMQLMGLTGHDGIKNDAEQARAFLDEQHRVQKENGSSPLKRFEVEFGPDGHMKVIEATARTVPTAEELPADTDGLSEDWSL